MRLRVESIVCSEMAIDDCGQATVEFAVVLVAFISLLIAFGAIWDAIRDGLLIQHALQCASHHLASVSQGAWADVFSY